VEVVKYESRAILQELDKSCRQMATKDDCIKSSGNDILKEQIRLDVLRTEVNNMNISTCKMQVLLYNEHGDLSVISARVIKITFD
jgi:hypothetical protein